MPVSRLSIFLVLLLTMFACIVPDIGLADQDSISTNAAQTIIVGLTQNVTETFTSTIAPTLTLTFTPTLIYPTARFPSETPTETPQPGTETVTPEITDMATPGPVTISVTRPTHCRSGPGKQFEIVGSLLVGMKANVIGREPTNQYWYIENPYVFTEYCWVWGQYAEFEGNSLLVPLVTSPPTPTTTGSAIPTLDFDLKGSGFQSCNGTFWMNIEITSASQPIFESVKIEVFDKDKSVTRVLAANNFAAAIGCDGLTVNDKVTTGVAVLASSAKFDYNFKGNAMQASVTVCTEDDLKGTCTTKQIPLTP
jgi:hypothetical protein